MRCKGVGCRIQAVPWVSMREVHPPPRCGSCVRDLFCVRCNALIAMAIGRRDFLTHPRAIMTKSSAERGKRCLSPALGQRCKIIQDIACARDQTITPGFLATAWDRKMLPPTSHEEHPSATR